MAHSRRARWSLTCVCRLAAWLAVAGDPPPRLLPCQLRFASCDPLLFAPAGPGAGTVPLSPPVPPSWVSPPFPLPRAAPAAPAGTRGVPPTWWAGKKGAPPTRWVLARGALPLSLSGRLPAAPAGEGNANPSISGSKPPPQAPALESLAAIELISEIDWKYSSSLTGGLRLSWEVVALDTAAASASLGLRRRPEEVFAATGSGCGGVGSVLPGLLPVLLAD